TELVMAGNEQFRRNAEQAAATGIEQAIADIADVPTVLGAEPVASGWRVLSAGAPDRYSTRTRYVGEERSLPQSSADRFVGLHFEIESDGEAARNARDRQTQGVFVVAPSGGAGRSDFGQIGTGLN
ncbi:MAG: hypothetical protein NZM12_10380, partial [Steroidobacteraceae bacterium]|nr:hypothetical protein [Steroidobacteraceae bacterium]